MIRTRPHYVAFVVATVIGDLLLVHIVERRLLRSRLMKFSPAR